MNAYVVMSRDQGLVGVALSQVKADELVKNQIHFEEMSGGRPSVYIEVTELHD